MLLWQSFEKIVPNRVTLGSVRQYYRRFIQGDAVFVTYKFGNLQAKTLWRRNVSNGCMYVYTLRSFSGRCFAKFFITNKWSAQFF